MILGVTGSFGCGKSSALAFFRDRNWRCFDADSVCKELYETDGELRREVIGRWKCGDAAGKVVFSQLSRAVFDDPAELEALCAMVYPRLGRRLDGFIAAARDAGADCACELPLLYEGNFEGKFDAVLVIWAPEKLRRERLTKFRGFDEAEFARREARQLPADAKLERADFAVVNSGSREELERQLARLFPGRAAPEKKIDRI